MHVRQPSSILLAMILAGALVGCGARATRSGKDSGGAGSGDGGSASSDGSTSCAYANGTCVFDGECNSDERCVGSVRTTGIPHAIICKGICERRPTTPPPTPTPCNPATSEPKLEVTLMRSNATSVVARVKNVGCVPAYHVLGCCGEGQPLVEARDSAGTWRPAKCATYPTPCCDALPTCNAIAPGASVNINVSNLSSMVCCGTAFRVKLSYARTAGCADPRFGPFLNATSNALKLRDKDTCNK